MEWFVDDVVDDLGSRAEVEYAFRILDEGSSADRQIAVFSAPATSTTWWTT
jgi:carboxylate-amine ligase